jgi:hypothetical protein
MDRWGGGGGEQHHIAGAGRIVGEGERNTGCLRRGQLTVVLVEGVLAVMRAKDASPLSAFPFFGGEDGLGDTGSFRSGPAAQARDRLARA